ncbi:hypothetical protein BGZ65_002178 [Modicella reniformis]|uniref:Uncharacterized protein n=1 Tax=Modicella reniformis TaxID=1440133 RepID=A0A9P6M9R9_9FUNG|nr:hypothetical protein BGZ65_002178 [Modicella reniformis]
MATLSAVDTHTLWSSPKDLHSLKRRHTRGGTVRSHGSLRSLEPSSPSSPSSPTILFSESPVHSTHTYHDGEDPHHFDSTPEVSHSPCVKNSKHSGYDNSRKPTRPTSVPSWFGSLRTFTISTSTSSKGAFAPLMPSSASSRSKCRGRSSSIYYACNMDDQDSDSDCNNDHHDDEPITSMNGLKENRVRGPRMSWANLDPSLGGLFPQSYKAMPESDPEPPSPSTPGALSTSSMDSPNVEDLGAFEARSRNDHENDSQGHLDDAWDPPSDDQFAGTMLLSPTGATTTPSSSTFSFIKSYVPSLPGSTGGQRNASGASASTSPGSGFWSIRKLSINILGNRQYVPIGHSGDHMEEQPCRDASSAPATPVGDTIEQVAEERNATLQMLYHGNIHTLECDLEHFEGKALYYHQRRENQKKIWEPAKAALMSGKDPENGQSITQLQDDYFYWSSRLYGIFAFSRSTLAFWDSRSVSTLQDCPCEHTSLGLESGSTVEELSAVGGAGGSRCNDRWGHGLLKNISKTNPSLNALIFSCSKATGCNGHQLEQLITHLAVDLKSLEKGFKQLQTRFQRLTRLEIYGESSENCGELVHGYLLTCMSSRHLIAKDVIIPLRLLLEEEHGNQSWIRKDLVPLEVSFGDLEDPAKGVAAESRLLYEYFVSHIPNVQKHRLSDEVGEDMELYTEKAD